MMLESKFAVSALLTIFIFIQTSYIDGYVPTPLKCQLQRVSGPCLGYFPMYYYNVNKRGCQEFIYGGCAGNENRFETKAECEAACLVKYKPDINSDSADEYPNIYKRRWNPNW